MSSLLNDPWVVGIGGGILSGLIVTYISRALLSKRDNKEYRQKIAAANQEVIYAIRPCISEGVLPDRAILLRIIIATARKYEVDRKDMYTTVQVIQALTKEVMDSSFISAKAKKEYCDVLAQMVVPKKKTMSEQPGQQIEIELKQAVGRDYSEYRSRMISMMSVVAGVMTTLMTVMVVVLKSPLFDELSIETSKSSDAISLLLPAVVSLLALLVSMLGFIVTRDRSKNKDKAPRSTTAPSLRKDDADDESSAS